jgi:hypothetical protein
LLRPRRAEMSYTSHLEIEGSRMTFAPYIGSWRSTRSQLVRYDRNCMHTYMYMHVHVHACAIIISWANTRQYLRKGGVLETWDMMASSQIEYTICGTV